MIKDAINRIWLSRCDEDLALKVRFWEIGLDSFRADNASLGKRRVLESRFLARTALPTSNWQIGPPQRRRIEPSVVAGFVNGARPGRIYQLRRPVLDHVRQATLS